MIDRNIHVRSCMDGIIRCASFCLLCDYLGSIYHESFTSTAQCFFAATLLAGLVFGVHLIFAPKGKKTKHVIQFSLLSFLWCHICKAIVFVVNLSGSFYILPRKETFYGEAIEVIIVFSISHALFVLLVLLMWLIMLIHNHIKTKHKEP